MAEYPKSYERTVGLEGRGVHGYVHHPNDPGGETWIGMTRRWNGDWPGWALIDEHARVHGRGTDAFRAALATDGTLLQMHMERFRARYWSPVAGDDIPSQILADELFDTAILQDPREASTFLQRALNILNKQARLYDDIRVDGAIGPKTLAATRVLVDRGGADEAVIYMNCFQGTALETNMLANGRLESFAWGWTKRVELRRASHVLRSAA